MLKAVAGAGTKKSVSSAMQLCGMHDRVSAWCLLDRERKEKKKGKGKKKRKHLSIEQIVLT